MQECHLYRVSDQDVYKKRKAKQNVMVLSSLPWQVVGRLHRKRLRLHKAKSHPFSPQVMLLLPKVMQLGADRSLFLITSLIMIEEKKAINGINI